MGDYQVFWTSNIFFIKENWISAITRHYTDTEPNINILLTRNLPFGSYVRQWSYPLTIPLNCLWAKSNNRIAWSTWIWPDLVLFLYWFRSFTCTVRLLFHSLFMFSSCANKTGPLQIEYSFVSNCDGEGRVQITIF